MSAAVLFFRSNTSVGILLFAAILKTPAAGLSVITTAMITAEAPSFPFWKKPGKVWMIFSAFVPVPLANTAIFSAALPLVLRDAVRPREESHVLLLRLLAGFDVRLAESVELSPEGGGRRVGR